MNKRMMRWTKCCIAGLFMFAMIPNSWAQNTQEPPSPPDNQKSNNTSTNKDTPNTSSPSTGTTLSVTPSASWDNAPRKYIVQRGDTLWDISNRFLGSPWYWPKLWSKNPHIYNPHWIFPGNIINFYADGEWQPPKDKKTEIPDISNADQFRIPEIAPVKFGLADDGSLLERRESFLDNKTVKSSGRILSSADERTLLSEGDRVYLHFKNRNNVRSGEQYTVYRKLKAIYDPVNSRLVGYIVRLHGVVQIKEMRKRVIVAKITKAFHEIQRHYLVGPYIHHKVRIKIRRNEALVKGHVLRATSEVSLVAQFFQVFVNRGSRHGIQNGNTFLIYRRGGIFRDQQSVNSRRNKAREMIGAAVVIDTRRDSCVAVVTQSAVEIQSGDEVETSLVN